MFARTPAELHALHADLLARVQAGEIRGDFETFTLDEVGDAWSAQLAGAKTVVSIA